MNWIEIGDHMVNLENVAGFQIETHDNEIFYFVIHYPALIYTAYTGTKAACEKIMSVVKDRIHTAKEAK